MTPLSLPSVSARWHLAEQKRHRLWLLCDFAGTAGCDALSDLGGPTSHMTLYGCAVAQMGISQSVINVSPFYPNLQCEISLHTSIEVERWTSVAGSPFSNLHSYIVDVINPNSSAGFTQLSQDSGLFAILFSKTFWFYYERFWLHHCHSNPLHITCSWYTNRHIICGLHLFVHYSDFFCISTKLVLSKCESLHLRLCVKKKTVLLLQLLLSEMA